MKNIVLITLSDFIKGVSVLLLVIAVWHFGIGDDRTVKEIWSVFWRCFKTIA
jgi:hypothetical protein